MEQEEDYHKLLTETKRKEEELETTNVQLGKELTALKANQVQLAEQLSSTKAVVSCFLQASSLKQLTLLMSNLILDNFN